LIQAIEELVKRGDTRVRLLLVGQGPLEADLRQSAVEYGLCDRVQILGYSNEVSDLLSAIDIFVLPSLSEGLPLALLEAAAAGRPLIATEVGGVPEIVDDGVNGLLVPPRDPKSLANAVQSLSHDPERRIKMGEAARKKVEANWSMTSVADAYLTLLRSC